MVLAISLLCIVLAAWFGTAGLVALKCGIGLHQALLYAPLKLLYRVDDKAIAEAREAKAPVIYVVCHQSLLEPALMLSLLPADTLHILDEASARSAWLEPWRALARCIAFNATHVFVSRRLVRHLKGRGRLAVYLPDDVEPDARTFRLYRAVARIALKAEARVVPIFVGGARHTRFSLTPATLAPRRFLPQLAITALEARAIGELIARAGAQKSTAANALFDRMAEARFSAGELSRTLYGAVCDAAGRFGADRTAVEDAEGETFTYRALLTRARALARHVTVSSAPGEAVGIMLPNSGALITAFLAMQSAGRLTAMINYAAGPANVTAALRTGEIGTVVSSREFIDKAQLSSIVEAVERAGARIIWLEALKQGISFAEKVRAALLWRRPMAPADADAPAVMLFTSGSEGEPKAVVLSHRNILANIAQVKTRIAFSPEDRLFNVLPAFHAFGLTGGTILPLVGGVALLPYPSPLHFRQVPQLAATWRPTVLLGTDTFLAAYAKAANDEDFASLRFAVAGAEAVRATTRATWRARFGVEVFEGYGMTEAAPVVAVNSATHNREGTVGRVLPCIGVRLEDVEGLDAGGRLWLSGPNVMLGYMTAERPGEIVAPEGGWHDTGDIVTIDREGYLTLRGRARRFAKIAGEMVSLSAVEILAGTVWPDDKHAAVTVPDKRRGERIVLVTTAGKADRNALRQAAKKAGSPPVALPGDIVSVDDVPVLASGKPDYRAIRRVAMENLGLEEAA